MKNITYNNKNYLGIKEGVVPPAPQYLWINSEDNRLYKFGNSGWEPIRDEVLKGFTAEQIEDILNSIENKVDKVDGKGLSTNDYTNEEKARVAKNTLDIAKKANTTEYYPAMAVGIADNLRGRGEATEEEFTYRPSAGASNSISEEGVATMKRIKGNSVVWNQFAPEFSTDNYIINGDVVVQSDNSLYFTSLRQDDKNIIKSIKAIPFKGHKWLAIADVISDEQVNIRGMASTGWKPNQRCLLHSMYASTNNDTWNWGVTYSKKIPSFVHIYKFNVFDLTQMFGAGNEPSTIEEFYARIPEGVDIDAYNEGELINFTAESIKTTGLNQWDEQWEVGRIDASGNPVDNTNNIRSTNFIPVIGGATYYSKGGDCIIVCYDENKKFIPYNGETDAPVYSNCINVVNTTFVLPINTRYIKFWMAQIYGVTYNNDICINLSHSGVRDGEYEPYKDFTHDLSWIKKYFPNGMRSAGLAFDEITETEAIQRICEVDLGSLNWRKTPDQGVNGLRLVVDLYGHKPAAGYGQKGNAICEKLDIAPAYAHTDKEMPLDSLMIYNENTQNIFVHTSYTDVESFKAAMSGVKLYYELAKPVVTPIVTRDTNLNYPVWDWGTERAVSDVPSAPFRADIVYGFNAVDTIRTNKLNIEDILRRLAELEAKAVVEQSVEE